MAESPKVRTCLWFEAGGLEAAKFYVSLIPGSKLETAADADAPLIVELTLGGAPYMILNGGPHYRLSPAASIFVSTADQSETDRLWAALISGGGEESRCGWLVDRFGVSWQIVPEALLRLMSSGDPEATQRVHEALMTMNKIDIAALEAAFRNG